jgi:GT2 family glycosyltransferase
MNPRLSIIVTSPSLDRLSDLKTLIDSLAQQLENSIEFIFVAENSHRLLAEVRSHAKEKKINGFFVANNGQHGLAEGRNLGLQYASAPIIAMIDDDVVLPREWADSVVRSFEDSQVIGITGPAYPLWEEEKMDWLPEEFYWLISCTAWSDFKDPSDVRSAWGMNMAFRKEAFELTDGLPIGSGFHKPIAEDLAFSLELKRKTRKRIIFNKEAFVWHRVHAYRFNWSYVAARSRHIGTSRYIITKLYRTKMDRESKLLSRIIHNLPARIARRKQSLRILRLAVFVSFNITIGYLEPIFQTGRFRTNINRPRL